MFVAKGFVGIIALFGILVNCMPADNSGKCVYQMQGEPTNNPALLVPLYAYPMTKNGVCTASAYLEAAKGCQAVTVIVNLSSGPTAGTEDISNFRICLQMLQDHGVKVIGYIRTKEARVNDDYTWTQYGVRPQWQVARDMEMWISHAAGFPSFKGFFLDEVTGFYASKFETYGINHVTWYMELVTIAKSKMKNAFVVLNPATAIDLRIMTPNNQGYQPADAVVSFEAAADYWRPLSGNCSAVQWSDKYGSFGFGPYCHFVPTRDDIEPFKAAVSEGKVKAAAIVYALSMNYLLDDIQEAKKNGLKYIYFTDIKLADNPYGKTAHYWDQILIILNEGEMSGTVKPKIETCDEILQANKLGPYPDGCLLTWWQNVGCNEKGTNAPDKTARWGYDVSLTAQQVAADYKQYADLARNGNLQYQEACGTKNDAAVTCDDLDETSLAPFPRGCLLKWWQEVGCTESGYTSPKIDDQFWGPAFYTVKDVKTDMKNYYRDAKQNIGDYSASCGPKVHTTNTNECSELPDNAKAPFKDGCLIEWWKEAGCTLAGTSAPQFHTQRWYAMSLTVKEIKDDMHAYGLLASTGKKGYRKKCGLPIVKCDQINKSQIGPFPNGCMQYWWRAAGCTVKGAKYPHFNQQFWWLKTMSVTQIQQDMNLYYQLARKNMKGYHESCGLL